MRGGHGGGSQGHGSLSPEQDALLSSSPRYLPQSQSPEKMKKWVRETVVAAVPLAQNDWLWCHLCVRESNTDLETHGFSARPTLPLQVF